MVPVPVNVEVDTLFCDVMSACSRLWGVIEPGHSAPVTLFSWIHIPIFVVVLQLDAKCVDTVSIAPQLDAQPGVGLNFVNPVLVGRHYPITFPDLH